jgi:hypothetical protein
VPFVEACATPFRTMSFLKRAAHSLGSLLPDDGGPPPAAPGGRFISSRENSSMVSMPTNASSTALEGTPLVASRTNSERRLVGDPPQEDVPTGHAHYGCDAFLTDARDFFSGTLPVSVVIAVTIGVICGVVACVYYQFLELLLRLTWRTVPEQFIEGNAFWPSSLHWVYIPLVGVPMAALVGLSVHLLGEPGDLAYTIGCVHKHGFIATDHVLPMVFASLFSIIGGGSLGPEAPLVAICGSIGGWVSRVLFKQRYKNVVRKHTLNGMVRMNSSLCRESR